MAVAVEEQRKQVTKGGGGLGLAHWMSPEKRKQKYIRNTDFVLDSQVKAKLFCHGLSDLGRPNVPL